LRDIGSRSKDEIQMLVSVIGMFLMQCLMLVIERNIWMFEVKSLMSEMLVIGVQIITFYFES